MSYKYSGVIFKIPFPFPVQQTVWNPTIGCAQLEKLPEFICMVALAFWAGLLKRKKEAEAKDCKFLSRDEVFDIKKSLRQNP